MEIDYDAIGLRVKAMRRKAKLSQEQVANRVGISTTHMSNIETGNTKLSLPTLIQIANALSVSADRLLCDNVLASNHVFSQEAQELLADCTPYDIRVLVDILKASKEALRKDGRFLKRLTEES